MTTVREVLDAGIGSSMSADDVGLLERALLDREDNMADILRLAGVQFGLEPAIVAEVLVQVGLGSPISPEARLEIHNQFHQTIQRLRREHGGA